MMRRAPQPPGNLLTDRDGLDPWPGLDDRRFYFLAHAGHDPPPTRVRGEGEIERASEQSLMIRTRRGLRDGESELFRGNKGLAFAHARAVTVPVLRA